MKNKKILLLSLGILLFVTILFFISFILNHKDKTISLQNNLQEYIPQEELSDDEIRKTIISLYFKHIESNTLIAEAKCIDVKNLYADPYTYLIQLLVAGPENEKLESTIPEGTKINACTLKGNIVYVDLSREFIQNAPSGIEEESLLIYSIVNTLTELNEVSGVKFLINGEENLGFPDGKITFQAIFEKND